MEKEDLFKTYIGKKLKFFLKESAIKKEGKVLDVKGGFIIIDDIKQGEIGIDINQISDYGVVGGDIDERK